MMKANHESKKRKGAFAKKINKPTKLFLSGCFFGFSFS